MIWVYLPYITCGGHHGRDRMDLQLPVQSVPITTKVVSSYSIHGMVYSMHIMW